MILNNCPRCGSSRVRRGYRATPWWSAMIGRYFLHCNHCNWEFKGFAVPGLVPQHSTGSKRRKKSGSAQTSDKSI